MPTEIIMPKVDMVMESGTFVEWLKKEGESVRKGDPLFVIMTDKSAIECEAPASGILANVRAKPDDVIPVSNIIGYIQAPDEVLIQQSPPPEKVSVVAAAVSPKPRDRATAQEERVTTDTAALVSTNGQHVRATPLARKLAREFGLDLHDIKGCGPGGRIHKADVFAANAARATTASARPSQVKDAPVLPIGGKGKPSSITIRLPDAPVRERVPLKGIRSITAQRLAYSAATSPHIFLGLTVDMSEVLRCREKWNTGGIHGAMRPSLTAILAFVVSHLLPMHPYLNSSLVENEIVLWEAVHLGIATALEDDLLVPVVRKAQSLALNEMVKEMSRLLEGARARKLLPDEMSGSTFTISNLGMFGIEDFTAILNPPEAAILGVGKMIDTPVVRDKKVEVRPMLHLTLGTDHRINDGLRAARFLNALKNVLENPYLLL